jgi:hypothetical protein
MFIFHDSQRYIDFNKIGHQEKNRQLSNKEVGYIINPNLIF